MGVRDIAIGPPPRRRLIGRPTRRPSEGSEMRHSAMLTTTIARAKRHRLYREGVGCAIGSNPYRTPSLGSLRPDLVNEYVDFTRCESLTSEGSLQRACVRSDSGGNGRLICQDTGASRKRAQTYYHATTLENPHDQRTTCTSCVDYSAAADGLSVRHGRCSWRHDRGPSGCKRGHRARVGTCQPDRRRTHTVGIRTSRSGADSDANKNFAPIRDAGMLRGGSPEAEIVDLVKPADDDQVFRKTRIGAFSTTSLASWLAERDIDTLILAGITTSGVVLSTVREASDRDLRVVVLHDATADLDPVVHANPH